MPPVGAVGEDGCHIQSCGFGWGVARQQEGDVVLFEGYEAGQSSVVVAQQKTLFLQFGEVAAGYCGSFVPEVASTGLLYTEYAVS